VLRLQVRDMGIGIKAEDFGKLFTEFQQLEFRHRPAYQGTGLGLALTKKIVEFKSHQRRKRSGQGSTFTVLLRGRLKK